MIQKVRAEISGMFGDDNNNMIKYLPFKKNNKLIF